MKKKEYPNPVLTERARTMRHYPTSPESKLWQRLRRKELGGFHFRRQHPIGGYIVDFYCHQAKLVVEIDGESHLDQQDYDAERTAWLESNGLRVVRFWNNQVSENTDGVALKILELCERIVGDEESPS